MVCVCPRRDCLRARCTHGAALNRFRAGLVRILQVGGSEARNTRPTPNTTHTRTRLFGLPPLGHIGRHVFPIFEGGLPTSNSNLGERSWVACRGVWCGV
eukprot:4294111-Prymnesium_polylepis.1